MLVKSSQRKSPWRNPWWRDPSPSPRSESKMFLWSKNLVLDCEFSFLFEVFQSRHNYLSFGSKLLLRASVFSLLQLHWIFVAAIFGFLLIFPPGGWWSTRDFSCRGSSWSKASQQMVSPRWAWKVISWDQRLKWKYISKCKRCCKKTKTFQTVMP